MKLKLSLVFLVLGVLLGVVVFAGATWQWGAAGAAMGRLAAVLALALAACWRLAIESQRRYKWVIDHAARFALSEGGDPPCSP